MQNFAPIDPATATAEARGIINRVEQRVGRIPQMIRLMAHSPAAAEAYLQFNVALAEAKLPAETRALIASTIAAAGGCAYSRQIALGQARGLAITAEDLEAARDARAADPKVERALRFALRVYTQRGTVTSAEVGALREAGYTDAEIVELVATVVLNIFRTHFNLVAGTELDPLPAAPGQAPTAQHRP